MDEEDTSMQEVTEESMDNLEIQDTNNQIGLPESYVNGQESMNLRNNQQQSPIKTNESHQFEPRQQKPMDQSSILSELNTKLMELPEDQQNDVSLLIHSLMEFYQHHIKK